jgi:uncharacterized membrane protein (TIGR02234 family)
MTTPPTGTAGLAAAGRSGDRTELVRTVLLIALGAGGILFFASRSWLTVHERRLPPFGPRTLDYAGRSLYPAMNGLAIVALLVAVLVLISGSWPRRLFGVLLIGLALATGWYGGRAWWAPRTPAVQDRIGARSSSQLAELRLGYHLLWPVLTVLASALLIAAGALLVVRGGRWQVGWSARYSAPAEVAKSGDPWRRLDRGEDPTISDG